MLRVFLWWGCLEVLGDYCKEGDYFVKWWIIVKEIDVKRVFVEEEVGVSG